MAYYGDNVGIIPLTDAAWISQKFKPGSHSGIDIGWHAVANCPVLAWQDGVVVDCGTGSEVGNFIVLQHEYSSGHRWTGYIHLLNKPNVRVGDKFRLGEAMGNALRNNTGSSSGTHLHMYLTKIVSKVTKYTWGTMKSNVIDPEPYLYYSKEFNTIYIDHDYWKKPLPDPVPEIVQPVERNEYKKQLIVHDNSLRVRTGPSLSRQSIGHLEKDKYYNYDRTEEAEGYTWYDLKDGEQWCAGIEELETLPYIEIVKPVERDTKKDQLISHTDNLRIRAGASLEAQTVGVIEPEAYYDWFNVVNADGYEWYDLADGKQWCAKIEEVEILPKEEENFILKKGEMLEVLEFTADSITFKRKV